MQAKHQSRKEQMQMIMECRTSDLSDFQWCEQNGINKSSFTTGSTDYVKQAVSFLILKARNITFL